MKLYYWISNTLVFRVTLIRQSTYIDVLNNFKLIFAMEDFKTEL